MNIHWLATQDNMALLRWLGASQGFHQGAFTCPIFTDESVNFTLPYFEVHVL